MKFDRTSTSFAVQVLEEFGKIDWDIKYSKLKYYQNVVRHYMSLEVNSRGLLLYWGLGMGKSLGAIGIAMDQIERDGRNVIVLVAKSLIQNMRDTILKYVALRAAVEPSYFLAALTQAEVDRWIDKHFGFATFSANNMASQIAGIGAADDEESYLDEVLDKKIGTVLQATHLEGKLLIIDEVHNWSRAVTNGSKNSTALYHAILECKDLKCIFLTGTPIVNIPYEVSILMNALGKLSLDGPDVLPQNFKDFNDAFVDSSNRIVKNREKFQNHIFGFISYAVQSETDKADFPTRLDMIVERVHMTATQYAQYAIAREKEKREQSFGSGSGGGGGIAIPRGQSSSTYRVHSREISNCITDDTSPKFVKIHANIEAHAGTTGLLYSQFTNDGGLNSFAHYLGTHGWHEWSNGAASTTSQYALITGKVTPEQRALIVKTFNSEMNVAGKVIRLLMVSSTGAEGLDLKNVRHIHIMEPYWNWSRIKQVEARGIRHGSHLGLPLDQRNVQPYIYLAIEPAGAIRIDERSTDEELYWSSIDRMIMNDQFTAALVEVSIECGLYPDKKCRLCEPNNKLLYLPNLAADLKHSDTCSVYSTKKIEGLKLVHDGSTYYYVANPSTLKGFDVYSSDPHVGKWIKMKYWDPRYSAIVTAINAIAQE